MNTEPKLVPRASSGCHAYLDRVTRLVTFVHAASVGIVKVQLEVVRNLTPLSSQQLLDLVHLDQLVVQPRTSMSVWVT